MVGRLVQKKDICLFIYQLAEADLGLLTAAEHTDLAFNMLGGKSAFGKGGADLILGVGGKFCPDLINTGGLIIPFYFLLEISDLQVVPQFPCSF